MRQDCEVCGEFVQCKDGICSDCRLEGYEDETTEEVEKKEGQEG
jgi:hypothetical protein